MSGVCAIVTKREAGCGGRDDISAQSLRGRVMSTRTAKSCGPGIPTLMPSERNDLLATGARKPGPPGSAKDTVKTIAQGRPDCSAKPVVTAACFLFCSRATGAASARPSLRPLSSMRVDPSIARTRRRRENTDACSVRSTRDAMISNMQSRASGRRMRLSCGRPGDR
jgi:hypothetical protein